MFFKKFCIKLKRKLLELFLSILSQNKFLFHYHIASVRFFCYDQGCHPKKSKRKKGQESHIQESGSEAEQAAESDSDIEVLGKDFLRVRTAFVFICVMDPQCGSGSSFLSRCDPDPGSQTNANPGQTSKTQK